MILKNDTVVRLGIIYEDTKFSNGAFGYVIFLILHKLWQSKLPLNHIIWRQKNNIKIWWDHLLFAIPIRRDRKKRDPVLRQMLHNNRHAENPQAPNIGLNFAVLHR